MSLSSRPRNLLLLAAAGACWLLAGARVQGLLVNSLALAGAALALAAPLAVGVAILVAKFELRAAPWGLLLFGSLLLLPLPLFAGAVQEALPLEGFWGAVVIHALAALPWLCLLFAAALRSVDRRLEEQALLDASPQQVLFRVTLRGGAQGMLAAVVGVGALLMSEMAVADLCQVRTFAEEIYTQAALGLFAAPQVDPLAVGVAPATPLDIRGLGCGVVVLWLVAWLALGHLAPLLVRSLGEGDERAWRWRLTGRWRTVLEGLTGLVVLLVFCIPVGSLAARAGVVVTPRGEEFERRWSAGALAARIVAAPGEQRRELWQSAKLGVATASASVGLGLLLAWSMRAARWRSWFLGLLAFGLIVPGPLVGIAVIRLLNQPADSPLAVLNWWYDHTLLGAWLAQLVKVVPLATLVLWPAVASVPQALLDAATSEGAGLLTKLLRVVAPLRWRALTAAWVAGLALSLGELSASLLVLPPGPPTLVVRIFSLLHYGVEDRVAAICLVLLAAAVMAMVVIRRLLK